MNHKQTPESIKALTRLLDDTQDENVRTCIISGLVLYPSYVIPAMKKGMRIELPYIFATKRSIQNCTLNLKRVGREYNVCFTADASIIERVK